MNGHALFNRFVNAMDDQGISMDSWETLDTEEQAAWNYVASTVESKG